MENDRVCPICGKTIIDEEIRYSVNLSQGSSQLQSLLVICSNCLGNLHISVKYIPSEYAM
jgi:hypothetical protein